MIKLEADNCFVVSVYLTIDLSPIKLEVSEMPGCTKLLGFISII